MTKNFHDDVMANINNWIISGVESNNGIPTHPEFFYRITGDWTTWGDFLGHQSDENTYNDKVEDEAFAILSIIKDLEVIGMTEAVQKHGDSPYWDKAITAHETLLPIIMQYLRKQEVH